MVIIGLLLGSALEVYTVFKSALIKVSGPIDTLSELANYGYKLSKKAISEYEKTMVLTLYKNEDTKHSKLKSFINNVLLFIPGLNILSAKVSNRNARKKILSTASTNENFESMNDTEMYYYQFLEDDLQRFNYIINISQMDEEKEELQGLTELGEPVIAKLDTVAFEFEPLPYRAYTKEETDKIVAATPGKHQYCTIGGRNICIIDIPELGDWDSIKKVKYLMYDENIDYDIIKISDEDAKGPFIIYPLCHPFEELDSTLKCYNEICKERDKKEKNYRLYTSETVRDNDMVLKRKMY